MPSRTYNILAVGKPILALAESDSEIAKVIDEENAGWTVLPDDPDALLETIFKIYDQRENIDEIEKNSRRAAEEKYSLSAAILNYKNSLK
jgi:glycosyltransferase involved in cell wall biosynthesis